MAIEAIEVFEAIDLLDRVGGVYCAIGYQIKRRDMQKANAYMRLGISVLQKHRPESDALEAGYNNYGVLKEMENMPPSQLELSQWQAPDLFDASSLEWPTVNCSILAS